jgi:hypothetical protein
MKVHKQSILIEAHMGYLEVISFFDTITKTYGADIYYEDQLSETIISMNQEPMREHLLSLGYHFILKKEKKQAG